MSHTFFFYDLETSGFNPRRDRIMQFGGQRTDMDLKPIGDPVNVLIKMSPDTVPSPDAILVTGITPQKTLQDGITEAEFVRKFEKDIATPDTIFVGFNTIRFDDEFMRFLLYRNFADAYEWQWKNGSSRWDLLDVVRMTRALRPDGIKWPVDSEGKPGNRLEMLASLNGLEHSDAHDALSDVTATIALAWLIKQKQPKLFSYLLSMRDKRKIRQFVQNELTFVYSSGKYPSEFEKTTIVRTLGSHPKSNGVLVYDLRHDPEQYLSLNPEALVEKWKWKKDSDEPRLPVKSLQFNRCPAVAPLGVLDETSIDRLQIDMGVIDKHRQILEKNQKGFYDKLIKALAIMDKSHQTQLVANELLVDEQLYDGFINDRDRHIMQKVRDTKPEELSSKASQFNDSRLKNLIPLYKARNFPKYLDETERNAWERYQKIRLENQLPRYFERLAVLSASETLTSEQQYLLEELRLYGESLLPGE